MKHNYSLPVDLRIDNNSLENVNEPLDSNECALFSVPNTEEPIEVDRIVEHLSANSDNVVVLPFDDMNVEEIDSVKSIVNTNIIQTHDDYVHRTDQIVELVSVVEEPTTNVVPELTERGIFTEVSSLKYKRWNFIFYLNRSSRASNE